MLRRLLVAAATLAAIGAPVFAQTAAPNGTEQHEGDPQAGKRIFAQCSACHRIGSGAANAIGPQLNGVIGRPAASVRGYSYSPAMKKSGLTWDDATLANFLHSPKQVVPGTKMTFAGLKNQQDIDNVTAYIAQAGGVGNNSH